MTEEPKVIPNDVTALSFTFASDTIQILREEEAYSFLSLVADCGGVLGLFIGFNFLMIWDWLFIVLTSCFPDMKNNILSLKVAYLDNDKS